MAYVYIVECADGTFYTGWTTDLEARMEAHNRGRGGSYTRSRLPVRLIYCEEAEGKSEALKREAAIKKMSRVEKKKMMESVQGLPD
jgi:putative endonuclease